MNLTNQRLFRVLGSKKRNVYLTQHRDINSDINTDINRYKLKTTLHYLTRKYKNQIYTYHIFKGHKPKFETVCQMDVLQDFSVFQIDTPKVVICGDSQHRRPKTFAILHRMVPILECNIMICSMESMARCPGHGIQVTPYKNNVVFWLCFPNSKIFFNEIC